MIQDGYCDMAIPLGKIELQLCSDNETNQTSQLAVQKTSHRFRTPQILKEILLECGAPQL